MKMIASTKNSYRHLDCRKCSNLIFCNSYPLSMGKTLSFCCFCWISIRLQPLSNSLLYVISYVVLFCVFTGPFEVSPDFNHSGTLDSVLVVING